MKTPMRAIAALFFGASLFGIALSPSGAQTPPPAQTPGAVYCRPTPIPYGSLSSSATLNNAILQAASCPVAPGDLWTDGPLSNPTPTFSGSAFTLSPPAMTWYVKGGSVRTKAQTLGPVAVSSTSYWWLDAATNAFTGTTLNVAPTVTSDLEYTVTSNGSGITGVVNAPETSLTIPGGITLGNLSASSCMGTNGSNVISSNTSCLQGLAAATPVSSSAPNPIHVGGTATNPTADCNSAPWACAVLLQAASYGVVAGGAGVDNQTSMQNAANAGCGLQVGVGGVTIQLPQGDVRWTPGVQVSCSNVTVAGYGMGNGNNTSHYPNGNPAATIIGCYANSSSPLLIFEQNSGSTPAPQSANGIHDLQINDQGETCPSGVQVTGQFAWRAENVTTVGFSHAGIDLLGDLLSQSADILGGDSQPILHNILCSQNAAGDGPCVLLEGKFYPSVGANGDGSDVFGAVIDSITCAMANSPCIRFGRSDDNTAYNVHAVATAGFGSATPPPVDFSCGSQSNTVHGYLAGGTGLHVAGNASCPTPTPAPTSTPKDPTILPASASIVTDLKVADGGGGSPNVETGADLLWIDDLGNPHYVSTTTTPAKYISFETGVSRNQAGPPDGAPIATSDGTNLYLGTHGSSQCSQVRFPTTGLGNSALGNTWTNYLSYIDCVTGGLAFNGSSTVYGATSASVNGTLSANAVHGAAFQNASWTGNAGKYVSLDNSGNFTPVPSPTPAPTASPAAGYLVTQQNTGNTSLSTNGTTGNTYVQLGTDLTGTTGVSNATGWYGIVTENLQVGNNVSGENFYGCIKTASTVSTVVGTHQGGSTCATADTGAKAGTSLFGQQATSNSSQSGFATYEFTIANSAAFDFVCEAAGSNTTVTTVYGWCSVKLWPY